MVSAAINALRGLEWVDTVVLLPHGRCTLIQELLMTTVLGNTEHKVSLMSPSYLSTTR